MKISAYKNALDPKGTTIDLVTVLQNIKKGTYREHVEYLRSLDKEAYATEKKTMLPAVTFSGIFDPTRLDKNIRSYSGIVTCDIDHLPEIEFEDVREKICADPHTYVLFTSPGGDGLKVLVPVSSPKEQHIQAFECVRIYFKTTFGVDLDPSGKNIARLCFVSFDKDLYFNGKATPLPVIIDEAMAKTVYSDRSKTYGEFNITNDDNEAYKVCAMWAEYDIKYEEGSRNSHIHRLACNLNRVGVKQTSALLMILRDKTDMQAEECRQIVDGVYKRNHEEHATEKVYEFEKSQDAKRGSLTFKSPLQIGEQIANSPTTGLISTGFEKRDSMFGGGLQRGSLYGFIGMEKTFKSLDAIRMACNVSQSDPVLYMNGEMTDQQIVQVIAQQEIAIKRTHFRSDLQRVNDYFKSHLDKLCIVSGDSFTREQITKTCNSIESHFKQCPALIVIDGLKQMSAGKSRETILAMIENAEVAKNIAKETNCAVVVIVHTDASCRPWYRDPRNFVLGKSQVRRNFDASISFSRFIEDGKFTDENTFELRNDRYCIRIQDDRLTGEAEYVVMELPENARPAETNEEPFMLEVKMNEKQY